MTRNEEQTMPESPAPRTAGGAGDLPPAPGAARWIVLAVSVACFAAITAAVVSGATQGWDERAIAQLRLGEGTSSYQGPAWALDAVVALTTVGSWLVLVPVALGATILLVRADRPWQGWLMLIAAASGWGLERVIKVLVARPRPSVVVHLVRVGSPSYPSGHAMLSAVVYLTLAWVLARAIGGRRARTWLTVAAAALAGTIGLTRPLLGVHYLTDVLGGWSAGAAWALSCWLVARYLERWSLRRGRAG